MLCGCSYCLSTLKPTAITEWVDWPDNAPERQENAQGTTAVRPECGIDSAIGSGSSNSIDRELQSAMRRNWFSWRRG